MRTIFTPVSVNLKKLRKERGISQQQLARKLNITRTCLANYETGARQPDNSMLVRIADVFHVTVDFLVNRSSYRNLELSPEELNEFTHIKYKLENHGNILSLTPLSLEGRVAVIEYFEHLIKKQ